MHNFIMENLRRYFYNYSGLSRSCWLSIALTLIQSTATGICFFISLYYVKTLHIDIATTGTFLSCYGVGTMLGGLLAGKLADSYSPKWIAVTCLLTEAWAFVGLSYLTAPYLIMITLFILGLSFYGFRTTNDVWRLGQCANDENLRLRIINISRAAMNLGLGLSGIIIGALADNGFQPIFRFFGMLLIFSSLLLFKQQAPIKTQEEVASEPPISEKLANNKPTLITTLASLFAVGLMIAQLGTTYPLYVIDTFPDLGMRAVSILYLLDTLLIVFTQTPLINYLETYNKTILMGLGACMMGTGMLILGLAPNFSLAVISCLVWTTGEMLFMPTAQALCYEHSNANQKGRTMGLFQSVFASSTIIGPSLGGYIYYNTKGNALWNLCFALGVGCLIACLRLLSTTEANTATQEG